VDDDGTAYVWDAARRAFVPQEEPGGSGAGAAAGVAAALPSYAPEEMVFPDDEEPPLPQPPPLRAPEDAEGLLGSDEDADAALAAADAATDGPADGPADAARRQREAIVERERARLKERGEKRAAARAEAPKVNTSVYVTGLPDDATPAEMAEVFGRCGLLKEDDDGAPRVKLYVDKASGMPKGDGLVIYLKEPSVALACTILDGACFRPGQGQPMSVAPAKFELRVKDKGGDKGAGGGGKAPGEGGAPKPKPAAAKKRKAGGAGADKSLGWDGFDDVADPRKVVVVLSGMFAPEELAGDAAAEALRAEVVAECARFGGVDKARVFARNPAGVVTVKFRDAEAARACLARMHGRWFGGRAISAALYDGRTDLDVRPRGETEEEQAARLERYAAELEAGFAAD
jgi:HIV Tat-specific factor 1